VGDAKRLHVAPIAAGDARRIIETLHYSGKTVTNSQIHLGVFLDGRCGGALQFGPSLDKRKIQGLVSGTPWNGFLELNRLAFAEWLPRNSESRVLGVALRWLKKNYPWLQWVISFADATQCGDGAIYRASGFVLTGIKQNKDLIRRADGTVIHHMTLKSSPLAPRPELGGRSYYQLTGGRYDIKAYAAAVGGHLQTGFQLRYLYFLDPAARARLTVPMLPFSEIGAAGAGMYRGAPRVRSAENGTAAPTAGGGVIPTRTLQKKRGPHARP
jgi:hypothetical protein